jgi:hypothetical protein
VPSCHLGVTVTGKNDLWRDGVVTCGSMCPISRRDGDRQEMCIFWLS